MSVADYNKAYFVVRAKENLQFKRIESRPKNRKFGILCDQDVLLTGINSSERYPERLRRIKFYDSEYDRTFVFLTNNFKINAETITQLYKQRWGIELFFKWIKQNLKVQSFWGFSENAVKTQIWVAISVYVLVAIAKKKLNLTHTPYEIIQYISLCYWENGRNHPHLIYYPRIIAFLGYYPFDHETVSFGGKIRRYRYEHVD